MKTNKIITILFLFLISVNTTSAAVISNGTWGIEIDALAAPEAPATTPYTLSSGTWGIEIIASSIPSTAPTISNESPTNQSTNQAMQPTCSVTVTDANGQYMNVTFASNYTGSWVNYQTNSNVDSGSTPDWVFEAANTNLTKYYWRVYAHDGTYNISETYHFTTLANSTGAIKTTSSGTWGIEVKIEYDTWTEYSDSYHLIYAPSGFIFPSNFNATTDTETSINLTWTKSQNATHTYVVGKKESYPSSRTDGTLLYNGTGTFYNWTGLDYASPYYFRAWSYNASLGFSGVYTNAFNTTYPEAPIDLQVTSTTMNNIGLGWTKADNVTSTLIIMNETGYAGYATDHNNGTIKYNETASSYTVSALGQNTTYYFTAISYYKVGNIGRFSKLGDYVNETTVASANQPTNLTAERNNHTSITLNWTKGDVYTRIMYKADSYPENIVDGTLAYNGTANTRLITGLTPSQHYYFRAWSYNGFEFSEGYDSADNRTSPAPPVDLVGSISGTDLTITWTKGTGASRTVIRNNTANYPELDTGTLQYNGTGNVKTVTGVTDIDYYRGWSYKIVDGEPLYSEPANLIWGGLEINVYKQDQPQIEIGNYTVFITNSDRTETYENVSVNNPFRIDVADVPNGEDIIIQIQKAGYNTATQVQDLFENAFYTVDFYLAATTSGSPPSESGEDWYVDPDDPDNETFSYQYIIQINDDLGQTVEGAYVVIRTYVNTTDSYAIYVSDTTDSSGQMEVDLIPDVDYYFTISKEGYNTKTASWRPTEIEYYENVVKPFVLDFIQVTDSISFSDCINTNAEMLENSTIEITYIDSLEETTSVSFEIYELYNETLTLINTYSYSGQNNITIYETGVNKTRMHYVYIDLEHETLGTILDYVIYVQPLESDEQIDLDWFGGLIEKYFGSFVFALVSIAIVIVALLIISIGIAAKKVGMSLVGVGVFLLYIVSIVDVRNEAKLIVAGSIILVLGIIIIASKKGGNN
jgi:hypothetical protein